MDKHWRNGLIIGAVIAVVVASLYLREPQVERRPLHGFLYFGGGSFLGQFDLGEGTGSIVVNLSDVNIRYVSDFGGRNLLLTVSGPVNNQVVSRMLRYNVDTGQQRTLFGGRKARYVPGEGHLLFHSGRRLLYSAASANAYSETEIDRRDEGDTPVVILGNDKILYARKEGDGETIFLHDLYTGEDRRLESLSVVCRLRHAVWMADRGELFCPQPDGTGHVASRLDASSWAEIDLGDAEDSKALAWLPGQDVVVLQRSARKVLGGSRNEVWVYDLSDGSSWRLSPDQYLGESVAYKRY